jgi:tight adherence protein B
MGFLILAIVTWAIAMVAWFGVSKYFRSSDAVRIKERLVGTNKAPKRKTKDGSEASVLTTQETVKNRLAHLLVEKYQLGPKISLLLEQAGLSQWTPARLVHLCLMAFAAVTGIVWLMLPVPKIVAIGAGAVAAQGPVFYVWWLRKGRLHKFEGVFPETLEFISRSMRAGHAFSVSLEMIHREFQEPVSGEFRRTFEEHNLGLPLDTALQKLAQRVPSLDVHFFVSAVLLQKRTGGNLAEILDKLAYVMPHQSGECPRSHDGDRAQFNPDRRCRADVLHQPGLRQIFLRRRGRQPDAGGSRGFAGHRLLRHEEDREYRGLESCPYC